MTFQHFQIFAFATITLWIIAILLQYSKRLIYSQIFTFLGMITLTTFISLYWIDLQRPPFRTLGETRLWYALSLALIGIVINIRWKLKWFLTYSLLMATLFILLNVFSPENFDKTLMPALQSPWFIPHVIVYIEAYALLASSALFSIKGFQLLKNGKSLDTHLILTDNIVYIGYGFLTFGLLFGALWAKEAWAHYWRWDPKETWALLTWFSYLIYIHIRTHYKNSVKLPLFFLPANFIILLICWLGVKYLPAAQQSVHTYTN